MRRTLLHIFGIRQDPAQPERPRGGQGGGRRQGGQGGPPPVYRTDVPAHAYDIVMGMVDANSCVINVLCYTDRKGTLELSRKGGKVERKLPEQAFAKDVPVAIMLDKLKASTEYSYKISFDDGTAAERTFVTQRKPGEKFTFTIQADSHLDGGSAAEVYLRSLETITGSDFLIDLGDTFMPDKYRDYHD